MQPFPKIKDISETQWKTLAGKKIYFGHQSVGNNIIDGIKQIIKENPQISLNIVETNDPQRFSGPIFAHSPVGKNTDPQSKIDAFAGFMDQGLKNTVDIAFFKFCYIDITAATDVDKVFSAYKTTLKALQTKYPKVVFIHFTVPLRTVPVGLQASIRGFIKRIIGLSSGYSGYDDNIKRENFNQLIRSEFSSTPHASRATLFDLALFESTLPDGRRATFSKDGKTYYRLVPEYTNDGGHLNESGRKIVAEQLLIFLSRILAEK